MTKGLTEFVGVFFIVFTVGMTAVVPAGVGNLAPFAIGLAFACMIYAGGYISGAHFNPAVTSSLFALRKISFLEFLEYLFFQALGAVLAAYLTFYLRDSLSPTLLVPDIQKALLVEFLFTFALVYVVLNVAFSKAQENNQFYGLAIGGIMCVGLLSVGSISGGVFNPAIGLALGVLRAISWETYGAYVGVQLFAGVFAALIFSITDNKKGYIT